MQVGRVRHQGWFGGDARVAIARGARLALVAVFALSVMAGVARPNAASAAESVVQIPMDENGMPTRTFFPETGHHVADEILNAWRSTGLMIFGYPISEPMVENGRTVQYFERARLEVWPEYKGTQWEVQGSLLGNWETEKRRNEPAFKRLPSNQPSDSPDRVFFKETGHWLAYGFKKYWDANGGLWQFGYPISEEFQEKNAQDGQTYTVQYFERARFEYHPEHAGTEFEVLLGHLGRDYAVAKKIDQKPVTQSANSVLYNEGLFDSNLLDAFRPHAGSWMGFVSTDALGVRSEPATASPNVDVIYNRRPVEIHGIVRGTVVEGTDAWYIVGDNTYVSAAYIDPLVLQAPPQTFGGHWVDVSLSSFYAVAYDGDTPVYVAIIAAGRDGKTPTGVFQVQYQVRSEIMDSATVGIPPGAPGYYYLENVEYTQYFLAGGYALHGNYWTPEANFGGFTSNGCVGLMNQDAAFFWDWMYPGDDISIHY
ncbi:MAG TPA: L,D-transpeptidase family protein [Thermomicrobiales bacterium]|nr:L,D-transpeptidase family protein [Thermomicrobiales bacterium]